MHKNNDKLAMRQKNREKRDNNDTRIRLQGDQGEQRDPPSNQPHS